MFIFTTNQELWTRKLMGCDYSLDLKEFLNQLNLLYILYMFIFAIDQELWPRELMCHIMGYDHSLGRNDILKFIYYFMIIFLTVYIYF
jgi:hypothetical protein